MAVRVLNDDTHSLSVTSEFKLIQDLIGGLALDGADVNCYFDLVLCLLRHVETHI